MENPTATTLVTESKPNDKKSNKKGKGAQAKQQEAYRQKKNDAFQAELQASILKRLKISDPTNLTAVKLQSSIPPARVPITFAGLPRFVYELWLRMKAIGTRPFATLASDANYAIFLKCVMYIAESRVIYAQMKCEAAPPFPLTSLMSLTEMQLRNVKLQSSRLPFPLVIYMEAIGNFSVRKQLVVPVEMESSIPQANGAISFFPTSVQVLLEACRCDVRATTVLYQIATQFKYLPNINWITDQTNVPATAPTEHTPAIPAHSVETVRTDSASINFWKYPTPTEWLTFNQIVSSMESKKGFLLQFDVSTGLGSVVQTIRYPEPLDYEEDETLYYMNEDVPEYEEKLSTALLLGLEYFSEKRSRFTSSYQESYKHGSASQTETRHAVIWADTN